MTVALPQARTVDALYDAFASLARSLETIPWIYVGVGSGPPFLNSWVNFDADRPVRFAKLPIFDLVMLDGIGKSGTINLPMFALPPGFRPSIGPTNSHFNADSNGAFGTATVNGTTGNVTPSVGSNVYFSLADIIFQASPSK
jgi:hypothetical protein